MCDLAGPRAGFPHQDFGSASKVKSSFPSPILPAGKDSIPAGFTVSRNGNDTAG
jgi:hypothetical protein